MQWSSAKQNSKFANEVGKPVGLSRLERLTSPLSEECSNRLSYRPDAKPAVGVGVEHAAFHVA
jgi:hypothetical protein